MVRMVSLKISITINGNEMDATMDANETYLVVNKITIKIPRQINAAGGFTPHKIPSNVAKP